MPLLVTAHEDRYIRLFDITTGEYVQVFLTINDLTLL